MQDILGSQITRERATAFNPQTKAVEVVEREVFEGLIIDESSPRDAESAFAAPILAEQILAGALKLENWNEDVDQWIARVRCVAKWFPERKFIVYSPEVDPLHQYIVNCLSVHQYIADCPELDPLGVHKYIHPCIVVYL